MATDLGSGDKKSLNVELNIVPFIDLMSCLTAFLLVTAVWVATTQLQTEPETQGAHGDDCVVNQCDDPKLSVLVEHDKIHIGISRINEFERIDRTNTDADWEKLAERLKHQKSSAYFKDTKQIEIAATGSHGHPMPYQTLVTAMDIAVQSGFEKVAVLDPNGLSARPY